jgi:HSP20 family protein
MASLQIYNPFADGQFDDLFRGFFKPVRSERAGAPAAIRIDVKETDNGYVVHAEIPGVRKDEINVAIEGDQVTIAAEVKRDTEHKDGERVLRTERYYGNMYRSFTLPAELDENASEAKYDNGVLELKLVKKPAVAGRKLTIQ